MMHTRLLLVVLAVNAFGWQDKESNKLKIKGLRDYAKQGSAAIPKITPYFEDGDVEVRREAVKAVVEIGSQRSLDPLIAATKDNDPEVQIRAVDGLVNFYLPGYVERGISATMKRAGNMVVGHWEDKENTDAIEPDTPVRPEIVKALSDIIGGGSSMDSRANAARAMGILRARSGVPALVGALKSKDGQLIFESLIALQKIKDRQSGDRVLFLVRDLDERVQVAAIETAGLLGAKDGSPDLRRVIENTKSKKVRRAALVALAQMPDPGNRTLFKGLLSDKDDDSRAAAAEGLGRISDPEDKAALNAAWDSERKAPPRLAMAFALAEYGNLDADNFGPLGYLVNNLNQKAWRGVAQPYLSELARKPAPRDAMIEALGRAETRDEKIGLAQALSACACGEPNPVLRKLSQDEDPAVAKEALRALRILNQ